MKKRTLLASTVALIAAGMMGATSPVPTDHPGQSQQVDQFNNSAGGPSQEQTPTKNAAQSMTEFAKAVSDVGFHSQGFYRSSHYAKHCWNGGSSGSNRIKHGRSTRRKHRRA